MEKRKILEKKSVKILVIDDEIDLCELVKDFFSQRGYEVIYSLTGQGGLDAFISEKPYIVMLDLKLNDMSGIEVLRKIKAMKTPCIVIVITGSAWEEDKQNCMKLGVDHYIQKPFSFKALTELLKKIAL